MYGEIHLQDASGNPLGTSDNPVYVYTSQSLGATTLDALNDVYTDGAGEGYVLSYSATGYWVPVSAGAGDMLKSSYASKSATIVDWASKASDSLLLGGYATTVYSISTHTHNHDDLDAISGGQAGQYNHLNTAEYASVQTWNVATSSHTHDHSDLTNIDGETYHLDVTAYGSVNGWDVATAGHDHDADYLGISAQAADSELLDGQDSLYYAASSLVTTPKRTIFLSAAGGYPSSTSGATITLLETTTNKQNYYVLEFDATSTEYVNWGLVAPDNYGGGVLTAKFYWTTASTSATVSWNIQGIAYADDNALDAAYGTATYSIDTVLAAGDVHISPECTFTLAGSPDGGQYINLRVYRNPDDANDTMTGDARLIGVKLEYTTDAISD
jgi:hypothetical protein